MVLLDMLYISAQSRMRMVKDKVREFFSSQQGVANVVATIIVLLIVVLLIGVFWDRLKVWVNGLMDKIFGTGFDESGLGG